MKRFIGLLVMLLVLCSHLFAEDSIKRYIITETQLTNLETLIRNQDLQLKEDSKQLQKLEKDNKLMSNVIIAETTLIVSVVPVITILALKANR